MKFIKAGRLGGTFYITLYEGNSSTIYSPYMQFSLKGGIQWKPMCKRILNGECLLYGWLFLFIGYIKVTSEKVGE